jgi:hypothetical protein
MGVCDIGLGLMYGIVSLIISRRNIIKTRNLPDDDMWKYKEAESVVIAFITFMGIVGPCIFGAIMGSTDDLYMTYDSQGCDSAIYRMAFVNLYVVFLILWIFVGLGLVISIVGLVLTGIARAIYNILHYIIGISWREMCGCYVEYSTEQPVQSPTIYRVHDLVVQNIVQPYNTECPVCLTQRTEQNAMMLFNTLSCNHSICKSCFDKMAALTATVACPLCRASCTDV